MAVSGVTGRDIPLYPGQSVMVAMVVLLSLIVLTPWPNGIYPNAVAG